MSKTVELPKFVLTFVSVNGWWENEEYWYPTVEDAKKHMELFRNDDSGLYDSICIENCETGEVLDKIVF